MGFSGQVMSSRASKVVTFTDRELPIKTVLGSPQEDHSIQKTSSLTQISTLIRDGLRGIRSSFQDLKSLQRVHSAKSLDEDQSEDEKPQTSKFKNSWKGQRSLARSNSEQLIGKQLDNLNRELSRESLRDFAINEHNAEGDLQEHTPSLYRKSQPYNGDKSSIGRTMLSAHAISFPDLQLLAKKEVVDPKPAIQHNIFSSFFEYYTLGRILGTGGYAIVREGCHKKTGEKFAVKIINLISSVPKTNESMEVGNRSTAIKEEEDGDDDSEEPEELSHIETMNEILLQQSIEHPNIVRIHEFFINRDRCYIVMDLMSGPELMDHLLQVGVYTENDVKVIMGHLFDAVSHMHSHNIVHRDLKLENLVLRKPDDLSTVAIVDFGLAKYAKARERMEDFCGTPWYSAPEILDEKPFTCAVDSWALGVIMYALLIGELPFDCEDEGVLYDRIISGKYDMERQEFKHVSDAAKDLLLGLLQTNPKNRLLPGEASEHAWITGLSSHDSKTLHHAHRRLEKLAEMTRPPTKTFAKGEFLIKPYQQGAVYLLKEGECEVLLPRNDGFSSFVQVGIRRKDDFVGEMNAHLHECEIRDLGKSNPIVAVEEETDSKADNATYSFNPVKIASKIVNIAKREILGEQRHVAVRALTTVKAVVLQKEDMEWAVEHDYRFSDELQKAMRMRRKELRKMAKTS